MKALILVGITSVFFGFAIADDEVKALAKADNCSFVAFKYSSDKESVDAEDLNTLLNCVSADLQAEMKYYQYNKIASADSSTIIEYTFKDSCGGDPKALCIGPGPGGTTPVNPKGPGPRSSEYEFVAKIPSLPKVVTGEAAILWNSDTGTSVQLNKPASIAVMKAEEASTMFMAPFGEGTKLVVPAGWK